MASWVTRRRLAIAVAVGACLVGALVHRAPRPLVAYTAWALASMASNVVSRRAQRLSRSSPSWTEAQIGEAWGRWQERMVRDGAPPAEAGGIVRVVRASIARRKITGRAIYGVPVYAREGRVGLRRVWVLGYGWGIAEALVPSRGKLSGPSRREPPGHHCVVVVGCAPPSDILIEASCP